MIALYPEIGFISREVYNFIGSSLSSEEKDEEDESINLKKGAVKHLKIGKKKKKFKIKGTDIIRYGVCFGLIVGGLPLLKYGLGCPKGNARLKEARIIEQIVDGTSEVGTVSLNARQD